MLPSSWLQLINVVHFKALIKISTNFTKLHSGWLSYNRSTAVRTEILCFPNKLRLFGNLFNLMLLRLSFFSVALALQFLTHIDICNRQGSFAQILHYRALLIGLVHFRVAHRPSSLYHSVLFQEGNSSCNCSYADFGVFSYVCFRVVPLVV